MQLMYRKYVYQYLGEIKPTLSVFIVVWITVQPMEPLHNFDNSISQSWKVNIVWKLQSLNDACLPA